MNESLFQILKIEKIDENELYLYEKYFENVIKEMLKKYNVEIELEKKKKSIKKPKKMDILRIDNLDSNIQIKRGEIFEYILLDQCNDFLKYFKMVSLITCITIKIFFCYIGNIFRCYLFYFFKISII